MASSSSYSHPAPVPSSSSQPCNWDVFLSFRGKDTRKTFVDHLYKALVDRLINTYKDDETLPRGDSIGPSLFKAIEASRIAVIIFSKSYADSSWCLGELAYIMKCKDERGLTVMPVFYDVDPSHVRKLEGDFGRGFAKQKVESWRKFGGLFGGLYAKHEVAENMSKVELWRKALVCAGAIAGWEPKKIANGHELEVIKEIVDTISEKLLYVDEGLVGVSARLQELEDTPNSTSMASSSSYSYPAPISSSSSQSSSNWDVFLSFRGEDTRKTFVDHLYKALVDSKIHTYKDDETLPRGDYIRPFLFKAIKGSQIAVIIFSKNYAESSWCLEELAYIMKCKDKRGLTVMPVFYNVDPSEVRKLKRNDGEAFNKYEVENTSKVESWRKALVCASEIAGWEPKNIETGHESELIKEIVDTISKKLISVVSSTVVSYVDEDLVGMSARLRELEAQLDIGSDGVRMVGVWGVGGSGKTTLAYSLYMKISHRFQGYCIIENIREKSSVPDGLKSLQEKLLSILLKTDMKLQSVDEGKRMIRSRLKHSNVLIFLDDVDNRKQLEALVGSHMWFGSGSRIVITTRDEHVLRAHKVDHVHPVTLLSRKEAIMLFNKYAYNKDNHVNDYEKLSLDVVSYSNGLPSALKVFGSFLYDKDEKEWMSFLARLKDMPEMEIVEKLKISYDGLKNWEKDLFLDIACFFKGKRIKCKFQSDVDAMGVFDACGYYPDIGIKVLTQKALITTVDGVFDMPDFVQEMAHYIVRGEHPNTPEKHSRVWKVEEIKNMYLGNAAMENNSTEVINFAVCRYNDYGHLSHVCKILSNMKKLRWLHLHFIEDLKNAEGPDFLSNELQYISWAGYPSSPFPDSFQPKRLATLILSNSLQSQLWKDYKHLPNLKVLQLRDMKNLLSTPNFDGLPCLQKLTLSDCEKLVEIHPSLGEHTSLEYIHVSYCGELRTFPTVVCMGKLETLEIIRCHTCLEFPQIKSYMKSLVKLSLSDMGIDALLSSVGNQCPNLILITLRNCSYITNKEVNFYNLKHLEEVKLDRVRSELFSLQLMFSQLNHRLRKLQLVRCYLKHGDISSICELSNLQELDLSDNDFTRLDFSLLQLTRLKILKLSDCKLLVELPKLPSGLFILKADLCKALTTIGDCCTNCKWLCDVSIVYGGVITDGSRLLQSMLEGNTLKNNRSMFLRLEGLELAKTFRPPLRRKKCRLKLPENWSNDYSGFLICSDYYLLEMRMEPVVSGMDDMVWEVSHDYKNTWLWYVSFASIRHAAWWWDSTYKELLFSFETGCGDYNGLAVELVGRKSGSRSGPSETLTTDEEYEISKYTPRFSVEADSKNALTVFFDRWGGFEEE